MPRANANGIELEYDAFGEPGNPTILLIMGLGAQMIAWDVLFAEGLADRGFYVVRFDNRDVGLSTKFDTDEPLDFAEALTAIQGGDVSVAPYLLRDMAADAVGLLDVLGIPAAHVVGASLGGMIAQTLAIEFPERVLSLTSIMSTTGEPEYGAPTADAMAALLSPQPTSREEALERAVTIAKIICSPGEFDEERITRRAGEAYDRAFHPTGVARQMLAAGASGSRADALRELTVPTLVIHGEVDPLIQVDGGQRTAELVPGAELLVVEGMGHDLPPAFYSQIIDAITRHAAGVAAR
jgi:pimeloyl-ACP methyl ester carboxylesterase